MANVSRIEVVRIRQVFHHEALNFSVWLGDNIDALAERIGIVRAVIEQG